jgi:hypothetical protein
MFDDRYVIIGNGYDGLGPGNDFVEKILYLEASIKQTQWLSLIGFQ